MLYATWCGTSRDAGVWISEGLGGIANVFDVHENPDLKSFDNIVIGGSIRNIVTPKALQEYITKNKSWQWTRRKMESIRRANKEMGGSLKQNGPEINRK